MCGGQGKAEFEPGALAAPSRGGTDSDSGRSVITRGARASPPSTFYARLALAHCFTASGSGLLSPFCRDCPAYSERTNGSLSSRPPGPSPRRRQPGSLGTNRGEVSSGRCRTPRVG